jgi:hypothetical protein
MELPYSLLLVMATQTEWSLEQVCIEQRRSAEPGRPH